MLIIGQNYKTLDNKRTFHILGKTRLSSSGHHYVGECMRTGLVTYFNLQGVHISQERYNLDVDPYLFMPIKADGSMGLKMFVKREELPKGENYFGFFKIDKRASNPLETVTFQQKLANV